MSLYKGKRLVVVLALAGAGAWCASNIWPAAPVYNAAGLALCALALLRSFRGW